MSTETYQVTLELHQDIAAGDGRAGGQLRTSRNHVPGWLLRGALAAAWIRRWGQPVQDHRRRAEFEELFEGGVHFNPLFAAGPPSPLSLLVHKRGRGCGTAIDAIDGSHEWCPDCGAALEPAKGAVDAPPLRRDFSSELGPDETPLKGKLFGRESINADTTPRLQGLLTCTAESMTVLADLGSRLTVGGGGSTRGLATLTFAPPGPLESQVEARDKNRVVLRLVSPGVFVDDWGRPRPTPATGELEESLGVAVARDPNGEPAIRSWTRWTSEGGWHGASGLPKPLERCVSAGSTYLVTLEGPVTLSALQAVTQRGLGLRRHEGFGALAAVGAWWIPHLGMLSSLTAPARAAIVASTRDLAARKRADPAAEPTGFVGRVLAPEADYASAGVAFARDLRARTDAADIESLAQALEALQ